MLDKVSRDKSRFRYDEPEDGKLDSGTWTDVVRDGVRTARIACPDCRKVGTLDPADHQIGPGGAVTPSVVCSCGYHEHIRLQGWTTQRGGP